MDSTVNGENMKKRSIKSSLITIALILGLFFSYSAVYTSAYSRYSFISSRTTKSNLHGNFDLKLYAVVKKASMEDKTVIITASNKAWSKPNFLLDVFLESFKVGNGTLRLLNHLVIVSYDRTAHRRCLSVHPHCYRLYMAGDNNFSAQAKFGTPTYRKMMWKRIDLLASVLQMGFNFVFTDADIVWLQDPFPRFHPNGDFQIASDKYFGNPKDTNNLANCGFMYAKSNKQTIQFYRFWYSQRLAYRGRNEQDLFNSYIKESVWADRIKLMFLDTTYFGGFCEHGKDITLICTMHATCCSGMKNKIDHLKVLLEDWKIFSSLSPSKKARSSLSWRAPKRCSRVNSTHIVNKLVE